MSSKKQKDLASKSPSVQTHPVNYKSINERTMPTLPEHPGPIAMKPAEPDDNGIDVQGWGWDFQNLTEKNLNEMLGQTFRDFPPTIEIDTSGILYLDLPLTPREGADGATYNTALNDIILRKIDYAKIAATKHDNVAVSESHELRELAKLLSHCATQLTAAADELKTPN